VIPAALVLAVTAALRIEPADLSGLLWSLGAADCAGDELAARQCRGVRAARAQALRGRTFVVAGGADAIETAPGGFVVRGCLRCGDGPAIVTRGGVTVADGRIVGPEVYRGDGPPPAGVDFELRLEGAADAGPRVGARATAW